MALGSKALHSISQFHLIPNDVNEEQSVQQSLNTHSFVKNVSALNSSKRLVNILDSKEDIKSNSNGSSKSTLISTVFHSPVEMSSSKNRSIRQKISNMKPITPTHTTSKEDEEVMKNIDFSTLAKSSLVVRESTSQTSSHENKLDFKSVSEINLSKRNPTEESRQEKIKQINSAYKIRKPTRDGRSPISASNSSINRVYSHSPTNTNNKGSPNFPSPSNKILGSTSSYTPSNKTIASAFNNTVDKNLNAYLHQKGESFSEIAQIEKGMLFLRKPSSCKNAFRDKEGQESKVGSSFVNASLFAKETNLSSKNENITMEEAENGAINNKTQSPQPNGFDASQTQLKKGECLENKIEKPIANKSIEIQSFTEINAFFDNFIASLQDQGSHEVSKTRSILLKIKSSYESFLQKYTVSQNRRVAEAQESQASLKRDLEKSDVKIKELKTEIENLRKENEKLLSQSKLQLSIPSRLGSITSAGKNQSICTEENPVANKTGSLKIEIYKTMIAEQQNTIQALKKKEAKLLKMLYACKKRGLDVELVYNEEIKGIQDPSIQDDATISPLKKGSNLIQAQYLSTPLYIQQKLQEFNPSSPQNFGDADQMNPLSMTDSELYEIEQYEISNQALANHKAKATVDPSLKNQLRLDFTLLGIPKTQAPKEFIIQKQTHNLVHNQTVAKEFGEAKQKQQMQQIPTLTFNDIKERLE